MNSGKMLVLMGCTPKDSAMMIAVDQVAAILRPDGEPASKVRIILKSGTCVDLTCPDDPYPVLDLVNKLKACGWRT